MRKDGLSKGAAQAGRPSDPATARVPIPRVTEASAEERLGHGTVTVNQLAVCHFTVDSKGRQFGCS
jgi:hypothetical protein